MAGLIGRREREERWRSVDGDTSWGRIFMRRRKGRVDSDVSHAWQMHVSDGAIARVGCTGG